MKRVEVVGSVAHGSSFNATNASTIQSLKNTGKGARAGGIAMIVLMIKANTGRIERGELGRQTAGAAGPPKLEDRSNSQVDVTLMLQHSVPGAAIMPTMFASIDPGVSHDYLAFLFRAFGVKDWLADRWVCRSKLV